MKNIRIIMTTMIALFLLITTLPAHATPIVRLEVAPVISVGSTFSLGVFIDGVTATDPVWGMDEILGFGFDITADTGLVYNGATLGTGFLDDSWIFPGTEVAGSPDPLLPPVTGNNIELATLSFTANMTGDFTLGILSDMMDPAEGLHTWLSLTPLDISSTTNITVVSVPAPESVVFAGMLAGIGMIGWARYREQEAEIKS